MSQLWQQQLLYKQMQLQELQRQQQQQQQQQQQAQIQEMPTWQSNSSSHIAVANPSSFPAQMQEMPTWSNHSPQMVANPQTSLPTGNISWMQYGAGPPLVNNFANGAMMQQNHQLQAMRSMGLVPQQMNPSFYQNSQFLGMASNANNDNMLNKTVGSGVQSDTFRTYPQTVPDSGFATDTGTTPSSNNTMQNFLGSSFNSASVQDNANSSVEDHWSLQDKANQPSQAMAHSGPTTGGSSLDPEEEKLLYGDDNWVGSFARSAANSSGGGGFVNSLDDNGNNFGGTFSALQSGSWSALMQEALDASSSENGQNEEWSGLTVHKTEVAVANQLSLSSGTVNNPSLRNFQQNVEEVPHNNQSSHSHEQSQSSNGMWAQRPENSAQFVQRGPHGVWVSQQNRPIQNITNQSGNNRQNGWHSNSTQLQASDNSSMLMQPPKLDSAKNLGSMNSNLSKGSREMSMPRWAQQTVDSSGRNVAERRTDDGKQESPILFPNPNPTSSAGSGFSSPQLGIGPHMSHNQPMGNLGMNFGTTSFGSQPLLQPQLNQQSGAQMPKNQEQRFSEQRQNSSGMSSDKANELAKRHTGDEELNSRVGTQNKDTSNMLFNGSMPLFSQNRTSQSSQNMLELFQKVEKVPKTDNSITPMPGQSGFDTSTTHPHHNQPSSMQGFGLMLGPPSQLHPTSSHAHSPDISIGNKQPNRETLDTNLSSTSSSQQLAPPTCTGSSSQGEMTENIQNQLKQATFSPNNQNPSDSLNRNLTQQPGRGLTQQPGAATMFKNVWTNVAQQRNLTPSIIQSMMVPRGNSANLGQWGPAQGRKGDSDSVQPDMGTSSTGSQNQEDRHMLEGNSMKGIVGSKRGASEALSGSPASGPAIGSDAILQGRPLTPNAPHSTYSLLHQVQAMKGTDVDVGNRLAKRLRGPDSSPDTGPRMIQPDPRMIQTGPRAPLPDGKASGPLQGHLTPDGKMLSFISRENEERNPNVTNAPNVPTERPKISPQMAPSWFGQYGNNRNGQNLPAVYEGQRTSTPQFNFPKPPWNVENNESSNNNNKSITEKALDRSPITKFGQQNVPPNNAVSVAKMGVNEISPSPLQSGAVAPSVVKEKKRKDGARKLVPFHKVIDVPESIRSTSVVEMDWAQTTNRLIDKVEDEAEMLEEGQTTIAIPRRRLILTTKLTQHLIPAVPPRFLRAKADTAYESITFIVSNFALRDACSLICSMGSDSCLQLKNENASSERSTSIEKRGESFFSKVVEAFNGRFKKLEEGFIRLNKRTSVLEFQLECQELEMFSVINRMGRFHRRHIPDGPGGDHPSASRSFLQRAITAAPMPKNIQEGGIHCLSL